MAIGARSYDQRADKAEVSDLTVDCNLGENRGTAVGAVSLIGSHTRVRRVRAINFGTEAPPECFVISVAGAHPNIHQRDTINEIQNCVIEDCIVEQPSENNTHETTCLHVASGERPGDAVMAFHRGCVIRKSYVNTEFANGVLAEADSIEFRDSGGVFTSIGTLITKTPHRHSLHKNLVLRGATNATSQNPFNGVFPILEIVSDTVLTYQMLAAPTANPQGTISIGHHVSSHWVKIDDIRPISGLTYEIKTRLPHYRTSKNNILVQEVRVGTIGNPYEDPLANPFNGVFEIDAVLMDGGELEPTLLRYTLTSAPLAGDLNFGDAFLNPHFQGLSADGGTSTVVERNRVIGCRVGGPYHDTWSTRDIVIRNNHYHDVHVGPYQNMGRASLSPVAGSALTVEPGTPPPRACSRRWKPTVCKSTTP